jgi:uncharacterized protein (DUF2236 family)
MAAYRVYAGPLTDAEQDRYLAEQIAAAELLGIPRDMCPASRAEYREYFASVRPSLCVSEESRAAIDWVLSPELPAEPPHVRLAAKVAMAALAPALVELVPADLRKLAAIDRSRAAYALAGGGLKAASPALSSPPVRLFLRNSVGETTVDLIEGALANAALAGLPATDAPLAAAA